MKGFMDLQKKIIFTSKKFFCGYLLVLLIPVSTAIGQPALDAYLQYAIENNPGLKASYNQFEATVQKIPQVSALDDPNLRVSTFGQMAETRTGQQMARFSLEQMFPWFGTRSLLKSAATLEAEARYESFKSERNELLLKVKEAYFPLYEIEQSIRINQENLKILETLKTLAITQFRNGRGKLSEALRVDIMINESQTEISILQGRKKSQVVIFNKLLNRDETLPVMVDEIGGLGTINQYFRDSLAQNPKLELFKKKKQAAHALEKAAVKQSMPKLGVGMEYFITQKRPDLSFEDNGKDAYMAMFSLSLPIYKKKYKAAIRETQLMQSAYTEMHHAAENNLVAEYELADFELTRNRQQIELYQKQVAQTNQIINLLTTAYQNGEADFAEILEMQQILLKYQQLEVKAVKEYQMALAKLEYITAN